MYQAELQETFDYIYEMYGVFSKLWEWSKYTHKNWGIPPEVFCKKVALNNFAKFTGKYLCWKLFLIKLQAWKNFVDHLRTAAS